MGFVRGHWFLGQLTRDTIVLVVVLSGHNQSRIDSGSG